jgi:uncharacterized protein (DUF58 family)
MNPNFMINVLPWVLLAVCLIYLLITAIWLSIYPTRLVLFLASGALVIAILGVLAKQSIYFILFADAIVLTLLVADQFTLLFDPKLKIERSILKTASLAKPHESKLTLMNYSNRLLRLQVRDDFAQDLNPSPDQHEVLIAARSSIEIDTTLRPGRRGAYRCQFVHIRRFSVLRFWSRFIQIDAPAELNVYPDMQQLAEYAILARTNRLSQIGVRKTRRVGQDNNFERLRDYNQDDNYKHIDWRSTARRNRLTVKQFQTDQSQRVMFLLDCGRMMTNEQGKLSMVDHALNAILMLSYVALAQGDSVGMMAFSDRVHSYVPIRSGKSQMRRLIYAGFDRFAEFVPSRFDKAFYHFTSNCRRRSMVFLITNVIDEISALEVTNYLTNLTHAHLPVLALLRDSRVFDSADNPDYSEDVLYRSAAAANIILWRAEIIRRIEHAGVLAIDAFPNALTSSLVNQYLEAKAKHLL